MENEYTKSEKRAVNAGAWLFLALVAVNGFIMSANSGKIVHIGAGWVIGSFAAAVITLGILIAYIALYIKCLRKIKPRRHYFTIMLVGFSIITACAVPFGVDSALDLFGGPREITTAYYKLWEPNELHFLDGEKSTYLFVPKDVGAKLLDTPIAADDITCAPLMPHTKNVLIKYYPHGKVLLSAETL